MFEPKTNISDELDQLLENYRLKKTNYYKELFSRQDRLLLSQISKIPDSWDNTNPENQSIPEESRRRLTDIKRYKSWELRLEILYMYYLVDIENYVIKIINCRHLSEDEINDAETSANCIITELESNLIDFRYLLLSIAKRSISDLYYLSAAYIKFFYSEDFDFNKHFPVFMRNVLELISRHKKISGSAPMFIKTSQKIDEFFSKTSNYTGLRLNEHQLKKNESDLSENSKLISDLSRMIPAANSVRSTMKKHYEFLSFYYNRDSGKLFRYDFVCDNMKQKVNQGLKDKIIYDKLIEIRTAFNAVKYFFDMTNFEYFAFAEMQYGSLVDFIFKGSKILEYYYLRKSKPNLLQKLRNDILIHIENEYHKIGNIHAR